MESNAIGNLNTPTLLKERGEKRMCGSILAPGLIMPFDPPKFLSSKEI